MELTLKNALSDQRLNCPICNYKASCTCKYQSHVETHVDPFDRIMFKCIFCGHRVMQLLHLREHMFVHGDHSEKFKCFVCNVFCKSEMDFNDHVWLHQSLDKQTFKCIYCDHETYSVNTMKMHMLKHKNCIAVQECCLCHYKSKSRGDLLRHLVSHKESPNSAMFICNFCEYKMKHLSALKLHLSTHGDEIEVFKCCVCNYEGHSKIDLTKHFLIHRSHSNFNSFKCSLCNYATNYLGEVRLHMLEHYRSVNSTKFCVCLYKCHLCDYKTNSERDFKSHSKDSHKILSSDIICVDEEPSETAKDQNKTGVKTKILNSDLNVRRKLKSLKTSQWQLEETHKNHSEIQFATINNFPKERYLPNISSNDQPNDILQTRLLEYENYLIYLPTKEIPIQEQNKEVPDERKYQCDKCSFCAKDRAHFVRHEQTHKERSERKLFDCTTCGATFTTKSSLKQHTFLHLDPDDRPMLSCATCDFKTLYKNCLNAHIRSKHARGVKTNDKSLQQQKTRESMDIRTGNETECNIEESLSEASGINEKVSFPASEYRCDECSFTTIMQHSFKRHKEIHKNRSERKLFHCTTCGGSFTTNAALKRHSFLHMDPNEKPVLCCKTCDYTAVNRAHLNNHILAMHSEKTKLQLESTKFKAKDGTRKVYKCKVCPFETKFLFGLKRHEETHRTVSGAVE